MATTPRALPEGMPGAPQSPGASSISNSVPDDKQEDQGTHARGGVSLEAFLFDLKLSHVLSHLQNQGIGDVTTLKSKSKHELKDKYGLKIGAAVRIATADTRTGSSNTVASWDGKKLDDLHPLSYYWSGSAMDPSPTDRRLWSPPVSPANSPVTYSRFP